MDIIFSLLGFGLLLAALNWYRTKQRNERSRKEQLYTMTIKELIKALKRCDQEREVIYVELRYADHDLTGANLLVDLLGPEER